MPNKASKGGDFEREICKRLSIWWSCGISGQPRDDIFWRSSQSGGRATQRTKQGKTTYGSYGDIAAIDPIGEPLLRLFTIELKRGSSHSCPGDLIDFKLENFSHPWVKCLLQAMKSHREAGSKTWMLICRRDHRQPIVYMGTLYWRYLEIGVGDTLARFCLKIRRGDTLGDDRKIAFVAVRLEAFLAIVSPKKIIQCLKELE